MVRPAADANNLHPRQPQNRFRSGAFASRPEHSIIPGQLEGGRRGTCTMDVLYASRHGFEADRAAIGLGGGWRGGNRDDSLTAESPMLVIPVIISAHRPRRRTARSGIGIPLKRACLQFPEALGFPLRPLSGSDLFHPLIDGPDNVCLLPPKALEIEVLYISGKRQSPGILPMVCQTAEFPRIQAQFTRHLDMRVRKVKPFPGIDPLLQIRGMRLALTEGSSSASGYRSFAPFQFPFF